MKEGLLHRIQAHYEGTDSEYCKIAAEEVINKVRTYMRANLTSELHACGKMFGVLVCRTGEGGDIIYLQAFSSMLDGSYRHEGFVPPVYEMPQPPVGSSREESQRLQRLLFAQYNLLNTHGEQRNLLDIFADEQPILSPEEWFVADKREKSKDMLHRLPPSGAGECCAPKLLQYAYTHHLKPLALAEFWIGASPRNELRREGYFYPPCSGRCRPILRWMLGKEPLPIIGNEEQTIDNIQPEIVYEDEWLLVADKPAGLLTVPGKGDEQSLTSILSKQCGQPVLPAHRLDQDTSGLVVLAKTQEVYKTLQAYFQRRDILKRYEAVIQPILPPSEGEVLQAEGDICLPLLPNPYDRPRQMVDEKHGKDAWTHYVVREQRADGTILIDFFPRTGRTHQLRVHAAHPLGLNAPIVGDRLYGIAAKRMLLHAAEIRFVHPVTKKEMHFCIPSGF